MWGATSTPNNSALCEIILASKEVFYICTETLPCFPNIPEIWTLGILQTLTNPESPLPATQYGQFTTRWFPESVKNECPEGSFITSPTLLWVYINSGGGGGAHICGSSFVDSQRSACPQSTTAFTSGNFKSHFLHSITAPTACKVGKPMMVLL